MNTLCMALAQINTTVGDLQGNAERILCYAKAAADQAAQLVVFPELALSGYPPEDLVLKNSFVSDCERIIQQLADEFPPDLVAVIGAPCRVDHLVRNTAVVLARGTIHARYSKMLLPNYGVFDEKRHFAPGETGLILEINGLRIGIHICEDSWFAEKAPTRLLQGIGLDALINLSASPYFRRKLSVRELTLAQTARQLNAPLFYCNLIGGQDELVFDGASLIFDQEGQLIARANQFREELILHTLNVPKHTHPPPPPPPPPP
ncbi:MAG: NAD+ synthase, partial [Kiritimatiellae bacterium]|nr:NAD+ synthase [Kiritimatiellia bacterium]